MVALERIEEPPGPRSTSVICVERVKRGPTGEPFRPGFLMSLERRRELMQLLRSLDRRSQRLLLLWCAQGRPASEIANELGISRVHCYRLRNKALDEMLQACEERREARAS